MISEKPLVLVISQAHPALAPGNADIAAHDLFRALDRSGEAEAYFLGGVTSLHRSAPADCAVQAFDGSDREYLLHVGDFDPFMLAHGIDSRTLDDFGTLLDRIRPDIVHFHHLNLIGAESMALVRNRLPRARIVFTLHDFHPICHRGGLMIRTRSDVRCDQATSDSCHACFANISPDRFSLRLNHLQNMLGLVDRFIAPSIFLHARFVDWGISEHMIEWIPNGLPNSIGPCSGEARPLRNKFGFFGNIAPHEGPLVALDAVRHVDPALDLTLSLHGAFQFQGGAFCDAFDQALGRAGDRARYAGPYSQSDVARLIGEVDWVVVPSIWWETTPLAILESFRVGRPVLAGDAGGMAESVDHGVTGLLFRCNDAEDLARTMSMAASDPGIWDRMAASLPEVPTMTDIAARHLALYGGLLTQMQRKTA